MSRTSHASIFRVLGADGSFAAIGRGSVQHCGEHLQMVLHDVDGLLESASCFFCGLYPVDTPHFPWDEMVRLPWASQYSRPDKDNPAMLRRVDIAKEVFVLARPLVGAAFGDGMCPEYGVTYLMVPSDNQKRTMQSLAVEVMLAVDGFLSRLHTDLAAALPWLSLAYKNIIECTQQAQQILGPPERGGYHSTTLH
jgi:hypothetical protein